MAHCRDGGPHSLAPDASYLSPQSDCDGTQSNPARRTRARCRFAIRAPRASVARAIARPAPLAMARTANHGSVSTSFQCGGITDMNESSSKYRSGWPGGDQFMIHGFFGRAQMAGQALLAALHQIARIVQSKFERFFVLPSARGMRPQPCRRRTVAIFAAHAVGEIEGAGALVGRNVQRVASQAARRRVRAGQSHDLGDAHSNRIGQVHKCVRSAYRAPPRCCIRSAAPWSGRAPARRHGNWANCTNRVRCISMAPCFPPREDTGKQAACPAIPKHRPFFMFLRAST